MRSNVLKQARAGCCWPGAGGGRGAADEHPVVKRAVDLPPSADLTYELTARQQRLIARSGEAVITWRVGDGKYDGQRRFARVLLGKLTENRSQGLIDSFGLAPQEFYEKRFRKDADHHHASTATARRISLHRGKEPYPLKGGEQDRASVTWQLVARGARGRGRASRPGSELDLFCRRPARRRSVDLQGASSAKRSSTAMGELDTVHW